MAEQEQIQYMNIYQKLAKVRKQAEVIQRNKKGYGYTYVSEDEILSTCRTTWRCSQPSPTMWI